VRLIDDRERRARLARRHAVAEPYRVDSPEAAVDAVLALHATEAATPFLSLNARVDDCSRETMSAALTESRTLVKQLAMRRTVFVFPRDELIPVLSAPAGRGARPERTRLIKEAETEGIADDGAAWLDAARTAVLGELAGGTMLSARELRERLTELTGRVLRFAQKEYAAVQHIAPRVISWMGMAGDVARAGNAGGWRANRILWARMDEWIGEPLDRIPEADAYRRLVARYLYAFGPVTETDLVWWFGATKAAMRQALHELGAVRVRLEREQNGWVLPDDVDPVAPVEPWAAVLPALDPAALGWKERDFYLAPEFASQIFDWSGNCGTTAWWDGQIVGSYVQDTAGRIELVLGRDPGPVGRAALDAQARRLETWLDGERVNAAYKSPIAKHLW